MTILLTILGIVVLLPSLAGVVFGGFMARDPRFRGPGLYFALWWVPGVAMALGILVRDPATFAMGLFCFAVAGLTLLVEQRLPRKPQARPESWTTLVEQGDGVDDSDTESDEAPDEETAEIAVESPPGQPPEPPPASPQNNDAETAIIAADDDSDDQDETEESEKDDPDSGPGEKQ